MHFKIMKSIRKQNGASLCWCHSVQIQVFLDVELTSLSPRVSRGKRGVLNSAFKACKFVKSGH